jgi:alpha-tubulin suppressor-like RCC1 family protein
MKNIFLKISLAMLLVGISTPDMLAQINRRDVRRPSTYRGNYQRISSGSTHALEIRGGTLWAWGDNTYGELGDGTTISKTTPVQIGTDNNWVMVSAGGYFSHAIKADGTLWAWGTNVGVQGGGAGMLGIGGGGSNQLTPIQVGTDNHWISVASGDYHSHALKSDGTLWSWGYNGEGELGIGSTASQGFPVQVGTDNKWVYVSAGGGHSNAIKSDGTLWGWGFGLLGDIGDGTTAQRNSPVQVGTDTKWVSVAATTYHTLGLKSDGTLWSWGMSDGALGYDPPGGVQINVPTQIGTDNDWATFFTGYSHAGAIKTNGTLWMWGYQQWGQVGNGNTSFILSPIQIGTGTNWLAFGASTGGYYTSTSYAIQSDGSLWAWGLNSSGQVGDGTTVNQLVPIQINSSDNVIASMSSGSYHTVSVKTNGTLWAWGDNQNGQVGNGTTTNQGTPTQVGTDNNWISASGGYYHTVALKSNGTIWAWGDNQYGQLGNGTNTNVSTPTQIGTGTTWVAIYAGGYFTMAIKSDGTLWAWGSNNRGQLGNGTTTDVNTPIQIGTDTKWVNLSPDGKQTMAIKSDGTLWAWGHNEYGQLGNGTTTDIATPTQIGTDNNWISVAAGGYSTVALKSDGTIWSCGINIFGELGNGTVSSPGSSTLTQIGTDNDWTLLSVKGGGLYTNVSARQITMPPPISEVEHTLAIKSNGLLWGWGRNGSGELGDGTFIGQSSPEQIGTNTYIATAIGGTQSFALRASRDPFCAAGNDGFGQLGDGSTITQGAFTCGTILKPGPSPVRPTGHAMERVTTVDNGTDVLSTTFGVYPNPTSANFAVGYTIVTDATVLVTLSDVVGKTQELINSNEASGTYLHNFNAKNLGLSPGVYFVVININGDKTTIKLCVTE